MATVNHSATEVGSIWNCINHKDSRRTAAVNTFVSVQLFVLYKYNPSQTQNKSEKSIVCVCVCLVEAADVWSWSWGWSWGSRDVVYETTRRTHQFHSSHSTQPLHKDILHIYGFCASPCASRSVCLISFPCQYLII